MKTEREIMQAGDTFDEFTIIQHVGSGGFGDIYKVKKSTDEDFICALKIENKKAGYKKQALLHEVELFRKINSPYIPKFIKFGENPKYRYFFLELCGPSISSLRKKLPDHKYSLSTVLRLSIEMVRCIESFHSFGLLHRDIKPGNFLIRPSLSYPLALIDFGLSRPYINSRTNEPIPPRIKPGFVGTERYGSPYAHQGIELGRRDDMFSWFYSVMEMYNGSLPWTELDGQEVVKAKEHAKVLEAIVGMPKQMTEIYRLIRRMRRQDKPNYELIISFLVDAMNECGVKWDEPFDWETKLQENELNEISSISLKPPENEVPNIPKDLPPPVLPPVQSKK
ncbi:CK1 family protein kinase [Histomonas meleagridis]|uniref:CK1 family protein kinase n=1 Tax=Histomonas meleagridis TaxID=135588 RepID=UPI003559F4BD|nr:CK1 family protein kinase [Histomonas meleagridis]KAH0798855.1 CK1 family protein kinase [Histomonas meleagridis]